MKKLFLITALLALPFTARAQDGVFIVNPTVAETSLPAADIKDVLLGNITKWPNAGTAIKLVVLNDDPLYAKIIKDFTQRTPDQFDKFWKKKVFTGTGIMPAQAKTEADLVAYVAANPGAIGYVSKAALSDKVRVLTSN